MASLLPLALSNVVELAEFNDTEVVFIVTGNVLVTSIFISLALAVCTEYVAVVDEDANVSLAAGTTSPVVLYGLDPVTLLAQYIVEFPKGTNVVMLSNDILLLLDAVVEAALFSCTADAVVDIEAGILASVVLVEVLDCVTACVTKLLSAGVVA